MCPMDLIHPGCFALTTEYLVFYITPSEGKTHLRKGLDSLGAGRWEINANQLI